MALTGYHFVVCTSWRIPQSPTILKTTGLGEVLKFWFEQTAPAQWFKKDPTFDASVRQRFLRLYEILTSGGNDRLLADAQTALAAVIVLDQCCLTKCCLTK